MHHRVSPILKLCCCTQVNIRRSHSPEFRNLFKSQGCRLE